MTKRDIEYNVPLRLPIPGEDTEAMFRRLVAFSYAVGRQYRADGGSAGGVAEIEDAIRTARSVGDQQAMSHMEGAPGVIEKQDVKIREPLSGYEMTVGRFPKQTAPAIEGALQTASEVAPYFTPAAPIAAARDVAVGLREGNVDDLAMSAFGIPGKLGRLAKSAAVGAYALAPEEAEAGTVGKALRAIRAYHGSPYAFDRFDLSKIGTGEGAQSYGHGLYFAESEPVARSYRDNLQRVKPSDLPEYFSPGNVVPSYFGKDKVLDFKQDKDGHFEVLVQEINNAGEPVGAPRVHSTRPSVESFKQVTGKNPGHMYEVDIHADPEHFLDWDRSMREQRNILEPIIESYGGKQNLSQKVSEFDDLSNRVLAAKGSEAEDLMRQWDAARRDPKQRLGEFLKDLESSKGTYGYDPGAKATGEKFYRAISSNAPEASGKLLELGTPGIKYLDAGSRATGEGSRNYVIFDDKLIDILRRYAQGGEVEREGFDKGGPIIRSVINKALRAAEEAGRRIPVERAREMIASPFSENPESIKAALKYAESLRVPQGEERIPGSFYNVKQTRPVSEVTSTITDIPGVRALDPREMSWEDVLRKYKGATIFNVAGDRSNLGRMTHINERELAWPVDLHAGPKYMLEPNEGAIWANNPAHATGFQKAIREAAQRGPVIGAYHPMGVQSVDSSHNMIDALLAQIGRGDIGKKEMKGADDLLRKGAQAEKEKIELAVEAMRGWPGFSNAREASEFARNLEGTRRAEIVKFLDKAPLLKQGFPAVGETRVAITDPALRDVSGNMLGHRIVEFDPDTLTPTGSLAFQHSTYTSPTAGRYVGDVPLVQTQYAMPDVERDIMTKLAKGDRVVHPYSYDPLGRSSWRKSFETRKLGQEVNQEMLDSIMQGLERQNKYGLADGGEVDREDFGKGGVINEAISKLLSNLKKQRPDEMRRAKEMGYDTRNIYFHGTDQPINEFNPNVYVAKDPSIAEVYARKREHEPVQLDLFKPNPAPNIIPMFAKKGSVEMTNPLASYYKVFDPTHLRSVFADFNPEHANSADLMKSDGGSVIKDALDVVYGLPRAAEAETSA